MNAVTRETVSGSNKSTHAVDMCLTFNCRMQIASTLQCAVICLAVDSVAAKRDHLEPGLRYSNKENSVALCVLLLHSTFAVFNGPLAHMFSSYSLIMARLTCRSARFAVLAANLIISLSIFSSQK